jgi:alpha-tubulin suppressor-like RCC1 family protein
MCEDALEVVAGAEHVCARLRTGRVACWGQNANGQLGDGTTGTSRLSRTIVGGLSGVVSLAAGASHTCAILTDRSVRCWGSNALGQLGDGGSGVDSGVPVMVTDLTDAVQLAAGYFHTCAVRAGGSVSCWGDGTTYQNGDPAGGTQTAPFNVAVPAGVTRVAAGGNVSCVLASGAVYCWGANGQGQLGRGFTSFGSATVTGVSALAGATDVAVGAAHVCALRTGGAGSCWGGNDLGQAGDGTTATPRTTPVIVTGLSGVSGLVAGGDHTCAVQSGGQPVCWGDNSFGQLGDGTTTSPRSTFVLASGITTATSVAVGRDVCCFVRTANGIACSGQNDLGELGLGTTGAPHSTPGSVPGV